MASKLELKKIEAEYHAVFAVRVQQEYRIEELLDNIKKLEDNIKIQKDKEAELQAKIDAMKAELAKS